MSLMNDQGQNLVVVNTTKFCLVGLKLLVIFVSFLFAVTLPPDGAVIDDTTVSSFNVRWNEAFGMLQF